MPERETQDRTEDLLVSPTQPASASGVPDGIVHGTGEGDLIDADFIDRDGDQVDNPGQTWPGRGPLDDLILSGYGDDTVFAGEGDDQVFSGPGDDLVYGGPGNDTLYGGPGNDTLYGEEGDDKLVGEEGDDLLIGGEGNNVMYGDGNGVDAGGLSPDDEPEPGFGNDTLVGGRGDDSMYGGGGDDVFVISDDFGNHLIVGGETGEVLGDKIDARDMDQAVEVVYTGDEQGTINRGDGEAGAEINFSEIERTYLGRGDDRVEVLTSTTGRVHGGDGFDTLVLPDPEAGEERPVVTITNRVENADGTVSQDGYVVFPDGSRLDFESFEEIICFTPGTLIDTARGCVAVEELVPGDKVLTRDNGYQPLAWTGRKELSGAQVAAHPGLAPVRIAAGSLGAGLPSRDLMVSPRHRMLISGPRAALMFGEREVLVAAIDLVGLPGITQEAPAGPVSYVHVMCPGHEILRAEGSWTESFQPGAAVLQGLAEGTRAELEALFPELGTTEGQRGFTAARPALSPTEARALFAA
ncbi:MAG: Hint domain-containing protein [Pararhodobacter sp.]